MYLNVLNDLILMRDKKKQVWFPGFQQDKNGKEAGKKQKENLFLSKQKIKDEKEI